MSSVIVIAGYGPGISHAVAVKFAKGHKVALVSRTASKLQTAVDQFKKQGIDAHSFVADLGDTKTIVVTLKKIQKSLGSVSMLFWNGGGAPKPLLNASVDDLNENLVINVVSLIQAVQTVQDDLQKNKGAVLVTGGGFGVDNQQVTAIAVSIGVGSLAVNKAAVHKTVGVLHEELKTKGVFVGEVVVSATVKGTAWDQDGSAKLEADQVATAFEKLLSSRTEPFAHIS